MQPCFGDIATLSRHRYICLAGVRLLGGNPILSGVADYCAFLRVMSFAIRLVLLAVRL